MARRLPLPARRRCCALALAAAWPLGGCALLAPPLPPPRRGVLDALPADLPRADGAPGDAVLLVAPPQAQAAFDTAEMAYRLQPHTLAHYRDHEWAAPPAHMLLPLMVATLQRSGRFAAVLSAPAPASRATHVLQVRLVELVQDFTGAQPVVRLALQAQLLPAGAGRAASREIVQEAAMAQRSPEAGIAAANRATAEALRALAVFVLAQAR